MKQWLYPLTVELCLTTTEKQVAYFLHSRPRERCASYLCVPGMQGSGEERLPRDLEGILCPADHCVLLTGPWETHLKLPGKGWGTPFSVWPTTQAVLE